jgi:hypothetical protein
MIGNQKRVTDSAYVAERENVFQPLLKTIIFVAPMMDWTD